MVKIYNKTYKFQGYEICKLTAVGAGKGGSFAGNGGKSEPEMRGARSKLEIARDGGDRPKMGANWSRKRNASEIRSSLCWDGRFMLGLRDRESWVAGSLRNPVDLGGVGDPVPVCDRAGLRKWGQIGASEKGEIDP
jgi:hypothetical protein